MDTIVVSTVMLSLMSPGRYGRPLQVPPVVHHEEVCGHGRIEVYPKLQAGSEWQLINNLSPNSGIKAV